MYSGGASSGGVAFVDSSRRPPSGGPLCKETLSPGLLTDPFVAFLIFHLLFAPLLPDLGRSINECFLSFRTLCTRCLWSVAPLGLSQGISKYYTTQVAPTRVETLREIAKSVKYEIGSKIPGVAEPAEHFTQPR